MLRVETSKAADILGRLGVKNLWFVYDKYIQKYGVIKQEGKNTQHEYSDLPVQHINVQTHGGYTWFRLLVNETPVTYRLESFKDINDDFMILDLSDGEHSDNLVIASENSNKKEVANLNTLDFDKCSTVLMLKSEFKTLYDVMQKS